ncbi:SPFH domain-containing protein [Sphingobacterium sp.]|jgi:membrane protease subunit (stomatin/prohibitin family)|uniref:SPFH domain-containing protein n=1 Tax=Sphingobacterium sp. TaxID=341027 RepID=UPI00289B0DA8|nr:SPFH domain-containing protein [Sphingobacterium sp.]
MGLFNLFNNQLSEVIEWKNQDPQLLWYKFPSQRNEIKNSSKLILAPGQGCILVYEGKGENLLTEAGTYNLKTDNHPFFTTLARLRQNFESEHKLYIYFFRTAAVVNQSWGTGNPIKYIDPQYSIPVEIGLNGTFSYIIKEPVHFYKNIVANQSTVNTAAIQEIINNRIPQQIIAEIAQKKLSYNEIDSRLTLLSTDIKTTVEQDFKDLGLDITDFKILGTQFDPNTQRRIGEIADLTSQNQAAQQAGLSYVELEKLRALRDAAKNEGGLAGIGAQLGVGMEIGKQFDLQKEDIKDNLNQDGDFVEKLQKLQLLLRENILTQEEFDTLKKQILNKI